MKGVTFMLFLKPHMDHRKCEWWLKVCIRGNFGIDNITENIYMCLCILLGEQINTPIP